MLAAECADGTSSWACVPARPRGGWTRSACRGCCKITGKLDKQSERDLIRAYGCLRRRTRTVTGRVQKNRPSVKAFKLDQDVFFERLFSLIDTDGANT